MDYSHTSPHMSPSAASSAPVEPKTVRFQLISPDSPHTTARLPMRVQIYPHDATDSIVTTVKNFYGLYSSPTSSKGVSFEDEAGNTMIARYENFRNNMVVYVRVIEEPALSPSGFASRNYRSPPAVAHGSNAGQPFANGGDSGGHASANSYYPGQGASSLQHFHHLQEQHGEYISRPGSRTSRKRSVSPNSNRGRRSVSASTTSKNRSRSSKNRQQSDAYGPDSMAGYSSGDGAPGSNNGRSKEQQPIGNTDISLENIVEGGRRKRAKFESSELPLFAPPQMPAATSNPSVSPARRSDHRPSLPYVHPGQNPFSGAGALHSPQHYNTHFGVYATPGSDGRRTRASIGYANVGVNVGMGVLPTPDPTVSSMSEEDKDVAMQLMRLGEISNISYGRTSTSTQDDTFSGRADATSSTGATSDSESESDGENSEDYDDGEEEVAPPHRKQRLDLDGASRKIYQSVEPADDDSADADYKDAVQMPGLMAAPKLKKVTKTNATNGAPKQARPQTSAPSKAKPKASKAKAAGNTMQFPVSNGTSSAPTTNGAAKTKKANGTATAVNVPMSPASLPPSRKLSVSSTGGLPPIAAGPGAIAGPGGLGGDDAADLSSKPRCQRCRKSKKGCDRQRPCGRCRDAGIPAELCISEDEGNGRKGRYGRHMGVPVKHTAGGASSTSMQPPPPPPPQQLQQQPQQVPVPIPQPHQHQQPVHSYVPTAILSPSHQAPLMHAPIQQNPLAPQLQQLQQILPPQVPSQPQPAQPMKTPPALLPPAHISSTPIIAPTIPALMAASSEKNKKRKR